MTIIWCMVSEIWSMTDRIFVILDHFLPFYPTNNPKNQNREKIKKTPGDIILQMCTINDNHMMYGSSDMEHTRQKFLSFWTIFCPFTLLTTWKIKILKKGTPGDTIILHKGTKNHDQMLHCSWDRIRDGCGFYFSFWAIFWHFTPITTKKIKMKKKMKKKHLEISSFCTWVPRIMITWCTVPEIWCAMDGQTRQMEVTYSGGCLT